jgi:hypothetical protein
MEEKIIKEVDRIKSMMGIQRYYLNEQFSAFMREFLPKLGPKIEHDALLTLNKMLGKDFTKATEEEINGAIRSAGMSAFRKQVTDLYVKENFKVVDDILSKYDFNVQGEGVKAGRELFEKLGIDQPFLKDITKSWRNEKKAFDLGNPVKKPEAAAVNTARLISQEKIDAMIEVNIVKYFNEIPPQKWYQFLKSNKKNMRTEMMIATDGMANANTFDEVADVLKKIIDSTSDIKITALTPEELKTNIRKNEALAGTYEQKLRKNGNKKMTTWQKTKIAGTIALIGGIIYGIKALPKFLESAKDEFLNPWGVLDGVMGGDEKTDTEKTDTEEDPWGVGKTQQDTAKRTLKDRGYE